MSHPCGAPGVSLTLLGCYTLTPLEQARGEPPELAVTRDDVIQTAIQLLQKVGLDGLTLRRLATELGISAPTLYWHVKDKRELLDLMSGEMVRLAREKMPPFPQGLPWDEKIAEGMRRQYE